LTCPRCGSDGAPEHRYCLKCGTSLENPAPAPAPTPPKPARSWKSRIPWVGICWVAAFGCWFAYSSRKDRLQRDVETAIRNGEAQLAANDSTSRGQFSREALRYFDVALAIDPDHLRALLGRARALRDLKDYPQALATYERAAVIAPKHPDPPFGIGEIYREMKLPAKAVEAYLQAAKSHPESENIQSGLALALYEDHAWTGCVGVTRTLLVRKPEDWASRRLLGLCLAELGQFAEARDQARELETRGAQDYAGDIQTRIRQRESRPK